MHLAKSSFQTENAEIGKTIKLLADDKRQLTLV